MKRFQFFSYLLISMIMLVSPCVDAMELDFAAVEVNRTITSVQPMTGLVLWSGHDQMDKYTSVITLEFAYCLPCKVVTGKKDGKIQYDWSYLEKILNDIASRNHQGVIRFRYENPGNKEVGKTGATAVPQYIKDLSDYNETSNDAEGQKTYYADWTNDELKWFTKQFITDFNVRYKDDPRIAVIQLGFGHWSEGHIYGTPLKLGTNFPSKAYQKEFLTHVSQVLTIPWSISIDAADSGYTPIVADNALMALNFGLFDDSFMHEHHELNQGDGYNESCWREIGQGTRWHNGVCGGEISYYTRNDQRNFLNPEGMYGWTWEAAAAKYHITFMISNDATGGIYGTVERFQEAALASGYQFRVLQCVTNGSETRLNVTNQGVAPIYRDAYFTIGEHRSTTSLKGLLPQDTLKIAIPAGLTKPEDLHITSPHILSTQEIEFVAQLIEE